MLAWLPVHEARKRIINIAVGGIALLVLVMLGIGSQFDKLYEINGVARILANAEHQKRPIAHVGRYDGQFHFAGRLRAPFEVIEAADARKWAASHADGLIVTYTSGWQPHGVAPAQAALEAAYGDQRTRIWETRAITAVK